MRKPRTRSLAFHGSSSLFACLSARPSTCKRLCRSSWCRPYRICRHLRTGSSASRHNPCTVSQCKPVADRCIPVHLSNRPEARRPAYTGSILACSWPPGRLRWDNLSVGGLGRQQASSKTLFEWGRKILAVRPAPDVRIGSTESCGMSAVPPETDIAGLPRHVRLVPEGDIADTIVADDFFE